LYRRQFAKPEFQTERTRVAMKKIISFVMILGVAALIGCSETKKGAKADADKAAAAMKEGADKMKEGGEKMMQAGEKMKDAGEKVAEEGARAVEGATDAVKGAVEGEPK